MFSAAAYWSLWIRVPAYIVGIIIFGMLGLYALSRLAGSGHEDNDKGKRSKWVGFILIAFVWFGGHAYFLAWDEERVIAAFAEAFLANTLHYGTLIVGLVAGNFIGNKVYKKTYRHWRRWIAITLGWVVGILICLVVFGCLREACLKIPGVGWRMERMEEQREAYDDDYVRHGR